MFEHGAMVVNDIHFHKPLVLTAHGNNPVHVGCNINGNTWEFRGAPTQRFDDGRIQLDTVYASGTFLGQNHQFDPNNTKIFDIDSKLALSQRSIKGDEFYNAIPSDYGYCDHFARYIKEIHELPDEDSWYGLAYLAKLEVSAWTRHVFEEDYIIQPGILDSAVHCALAVFIDESKFYGPSGVFLPVALKSITRWDRGDFEAIDFTGDVNDEIWSYVTVRDFVPDGTIKFDYTVTLSRRQVLFTIEALELKFSPRSGPVPITDERRLTVIWQPKRFSSSGINLCSMDFVDATSCLCRIFYNLIIEAQADGYKIVRVLDLDSSLTFAKAFDATLVSFLRNGLLCDYFLAVASAEDASANSAILQYPHMRPLILDDFGMPGQAVSIDRYVSYFLSCSLLYYL